MNKQIKQILIILAIITIIVIDILVFGINPINSHLVAYIGVGYLFGLLSGGSDD